MFYYIKEYEEKKDSSNMQIKDWIDIAMDVKNNYEKFDSFIILHGTDTMSYTASVLSFMFQNLDKSVILTGSQVRLLYWSNVKCSIFDLIQDKTYFKRMHLVGDLVSYCLSA